jgi:hypothetical protein
MTAVVASSLVDSVKNEGRELLMPDSLERAA